MEHGAIAEPDSQRGTGKVALLIDGDNIPSDFAGQMLVRAARSGQVIVKRVYLDPHHLKNWEESAGFSLRVARSGRDAADLLLTIDAVDLAHRGDITAFVIASSDGGFAPLGRYLVERGLLVLGLGKSGTPADWRKSCTRFEMLGERLAPTKLSSTALPGTTSLAEPKTPVTNESPASSAVNVVVDPLAPTHGIDSAVALVIQSQGSSGIRLSSLGTRLREQGIDKKQLPEGSWLNYLLARPQLFSVRGTAPGLSVLILAPPKPPGI